MQKCGFEEWIKKVLLQIVEERALQTVKRRIGPKMSILNVKMSRFCLQTADFMWYMMGTKEIPFFKVLRFTSQSVIFSGNVSMAYIRFWHYI